MRGANCEELEVLIDREGFGWSEAEQLRVEQHLADCAGCRELLATSRFVRETLRAAQGGLSEAARGRALAGAFANATLTRERQGGRVRKLWLGLGAGAALSAAAAAAVLVWSGGEPRAPVALSERSPARPAEGAGPAKVDARGSAREQNSVEPRASAGAPVESERAQRSVASVDARGSAREQNVDARGSAREQNLAEQGVVTSAQQPPSGEWLAVGNRQTRQFGHATVALAAGSRVRFDAANSTLTLAQGRVDVDVEASRARPFRVATQHFRVEVLGTRFSVAQRTVVVTRGHVQIVAPDGTLLARDLAAGGSYTYRPQVEAREQSPAAPQEPVVSAEVWLSRARAALGHGDTKEALALVARAEASQPRRADSAEAGTLRAEAAQLSRELGEALARYRGVAQRFADLPSGENAAFAAAQLAARVKPSEERALLEQYAARYPRGRFADEVARRLAQLGAAR